MSLLDLDDCEYFHLCELYALKENIKLKQSQRARTFANHVIISKSKNSDLFP